MNPTLGQRILRWTVLALGYAFLYLPILLLIVYSFNSSRLATVWAGFRRPASSTRIPIPTAISVPMIPRCG